MDINFKNILILGVIAFGAVWAGNALLRKMGAADLQA
jgi:hypothetical protein